MRLSLPRRNRDQTLAHAGNQHRRVSRGVYYRRARIRPTRRDVTAPLLVGRARAKQDGFRAGGEGGGGGGVDRGQLLVASPAGTTTATT